MSIADPVSVHLQKMFKAFHCGSDSIFQCTLKNCLMTIGMSVALNAKENFLEILLPIGYEKISIIITIIWFYSCPGPEMNVSHSCTQCLWSTSHFTITSWDGLKQVCIWKIRSSSWLIHFSPYFCNDLSEIMQKKPHYWLCHYLGDLFCPSSENVVENHLEILWGGTMTQW